MSKFTLFSILANIGISKVLAHLSLEQSSFIVKILSLLIRHLHNEMDNIKIIINLRVKLY
jgi:hypothetical protein